MSTNTEHKNISGALTMLVSDALSRFLEIRKGEPFKDSVCSEIYQLIFNTVADCFGQSHIEITNEAMNYIAQSYYDGVLINGTQELNPNIFTQRAKLENMNTDTLAFLCVAFRGSDIAHECVREIKHRS